MKMFRLALFAAALLAAAPASAQWQTPNHSVPIGKGGGIIGFGSAAPSTAGQPFVSTGASSDPAFGTIANSGFTAGAANTVKGSLNGTTVTDIPFPDCQAVNTAIRYAAGSGPLCGNVTIQTGFDAPVNLGLSSSAVGGALTVNVTTASGGTPSTSSPVLVPFRSTTPGAGTVTWGTISSALSLTIPSGATLGTINSTPFRVWLFLDANGGTPALGVASCSGPKTIFPCASWEYTLKTSVTIGAGSTSSGVLYAANGVTLDAVRIIGYCDFPSGLTTAGTWASACTGLQVYGPGVPRPGQPVQVLSDSVTALSITPSSAVNHVKFSGSLGCSITTNATPVGVNYTRGVATILSQNIGGSGTTGMNAVASATFLDAPNTASSISYSFVITGTSCGGAIGEITLEEIMG